MSAPLVDIPPGKIINNIPRCLMSGTPTKLQERQRQWFVDYLPITGNNKVKLLIDGKSYGQSLYDDLQKLGSGDKLYMTGLHFDPDWALIREPGNWKTEKRRENLWWEDIAVSEFTLLNVLSKLIEKGVEIYIIVNQFWINEVSTQDFAIKKIKAEAYLDWYMPKTVKLFKALNDLNEENRHLVYCRSDVHPGFYMGTHHQKTVVINDTVCYLGGIDMTAVDGDRWDDSHHLAIKETDQLRLSNKPNKLWHDLHCRIEGPATNYVLDNFTRRWNNDALRMNHVINTDNKRRRWLDSKRDNDINRKKLDNVQPPNAIYQPLTRKADSGCLVDSVDTRGNQTIQEKVGTQLIHGLANSKVQIVRSMPNASYQYGKTKPDWNKSYLNWERSCKDAYLIGIRAAQKYIYIENQWIPDEQIWEELLAAAKRNQHYKNFRIVIVLPRDPLGAAGYGHNSDLAARMKASIKKVIDAAKTWQFGMYCMEAPIPFSRTDLHIEDEDRQADGLWAEVYVHSKAMIIDDKWSLIGSANAGGISLEGIANLDNALDFLTGPLPIKVAASFFLQHQLNTGDKAKDGKHSDTTQYIGDRPDTEIASIILDDDFAKAFRQKVWSEHLGEDVSGLSVAEAADRFLEQAEETQKNLNVKKVESDKKKRIRYATDFMDVKQDVRASKRYVPAYLIAEFQRNGALPANKLELKKVFF